MTALTSDLYDHRALYDALLPATAHISYYVDLARQASGDVLELACGTGQLTVPVAVAGFPAVGLDLSAPIWPPQNSARPPPMSRLSSSSATCAISIWAASLR